jgi:hypothetical protein
MTKTQVSASIVLAAFSVTFPISVLAQTAAGGAGSTGGGTVVDPGTIFPIASTNGPIAQWDFDEGSGTTVTDSINHFQGSFAGNPTWVAGKFGTALSFDGASVVKVTTDASGGTTASPIINSLNVLTLSAWVYARHDGNNAAGVRRIVSKGTFDPTNGTSRVRFGLQIGANQTLQFNAGYQGRNAVWGTPANSLTLNHPNPHFLLPRPYLGPVGDDVKYLYDGASSPSSGEQLLHLQRPDVCGGGSNIS